MDELNKTTATGTVTTNTDAGADSARDVHQATYTTTPQDSRVSSSDEGLGAAVAPVMPDPKEVTGQFDHLATRDPEAMDRLQTPEYAGAETTAGIGSEVLAGLPAGGDLAGFGGAGMLETGAGVGTGRGTPDANSGYTAPALSGPPHVSEQPGDLPPGESEELKAQVEGREGR